MSSCNNNLFLSSCNTNLFSSNTKGKESKMGWVATYVESGSGLFITWAVCSLEKIGSSDHNRTSTNRETRLQPSSAYGDEPPTFLVAQVCVSTPGVPVTVRTAVYGILLYLRRREHFLVVSLHLLTFAAVSISLSFPCIASSTSSISLDKTFALSRSCFLASSYKL